MSGLLCLVFFQHLQLLEHTCDLSLQWHWPPTSIVRKMLTGWSCYYGGLCTLNSLTHLSAQGWIPWIMQMTLQWLGLGISSPIIFTISHSLSWSLAIFLWLPIVFLWFLHLISLLPTQTFFSTLELKVSTGQDILGALLDNSKSLTLGSCLKWPIVIRHSSACPSCPDLPSCCLSCCHAKVSSDGLAESLRVVKEYKPYFSSLKDALFASFLDVHFSTSLSATNPCKALAALFVKFSGLASLLLMIATIAWALFFVPTSSLYSMATSLPFILINHHAQLYTICNELQTRAQGYHSQTVTPLPSQDLLY